MIGTAKPKNAKGTLLRTVKIYLRWAKTIFAAVFLTTISSLIAVAIPYYVVGKDIEQQLGQLIGNKN